MAPTINQSLNILAVDDEVNIRKTLSACLEIKGHKVVAIYTCSSEARRPQGVGDAEKGHGLRCM